MQSVLQAEYHHTAEQIPLIHIVHKDDVVLINSAEAEWFLILKDLPWQHYRVHAAKYYEALYEFNCRQAIMRQERLEAQYEGERESKEEARQRVLWDRATMRSMQGEESSVLYQRPAPLCESSHTDPQSIAPGVVPSRFAGRMPKCFFSMFKSFLGTTLMGFSAEPESVHLLLTSNPSFVRVCGFAPTMIEDSYCWKHVPSLRKLQQFD